MKDPSRTRPARGASSARSVRSCCSSRPSPPAAQGADATHRPPDRPSRRLGGGRPRIQPMSAEPAEHSPSPAPFLYPARAAAPDVRRRPRRASLAPDGPSATTDCRSPCCGRSGDCARTRRASTSCTHRRLSRLAHDRHFAAALAAGPVLWIALALALNVQPSPAWILGDPIRALSLVVAWPLLEEALFRGGVQPALLRTRWGAREAWGLTTANVATSLLFAAAHLATQAPEWAAGGVRALARVRPLPRALRLDRPGRRAPRLLQRRIFPPRRAPTADSVRKAVDAGGRRV